MPHITNLNIILSPEMLKKVRGGFKIIEPYDSAVEQAIKDTQRCGGCYFSTHSGDLVGKKIIKGSKEFNIRGFETVFEELQLLGLTDEYTAAELLPRLKPENPEFHIHFDVWGWKDAAGQYREGMPRVLLKELKDLVHQDSFNPFYESLGVRAAEKYRETPYLLTAGLTCKGHVATPEEARMVKIVYDALNSRIAEIAAKHNVELIGYTELELVSLVRPLAAKPFNEGQFSNHFSRDRTTLKVKTTDIDTGFKSCEFHFKLGKGYDERVLNGLIDIGFINAAMPPKADGSITPYFTMQGRNVELRNQLAAYVAILAEDVGGFGLGARIQLETIVAHKFFGQEFAPNKHLPQIVTGMQISKDRQGLRSYLSDICCQERLTGTKGQTIEQADWATKMKGAYKIALDGLKRKPADEAEITKAAELLSKWDDNLDKTPMARPTQKC